MKTLASIAIAIASIAIAPAASALDWGYSNSNNVYSGISKNYNSSYKGSYNGGHGHGHGHSHQCAPTYVCTREIGRSVQCQTGYDHCGRPFNYHVTVVTYANYYSDGSYTTFTKTYRA